VYRQASELISLTDGLKRQLTGEELDQQRLMQECHEVRRRIDAVARTVGELRTRTAGYTDSGAARS